MTVLFVKEKRDAKDGTKTAFSSKQVSYKSIAFLDMIVYVRKALKMIKN